MQVGAIVSWENGSYIMATHGSGRVVDVHDTFVVVKREDIAERYPHLCPYVTKRIWELRVVEEQLAAA